MVFDANRIVYATAFGVGNGIFENGQIEPDILLQVCFSLIVREWFWCKCFSLSPSSFLSLSHFLLPRTDIFF